MVYLYTDVTVEQHTAASQHSLWVQQHTTAALPLQQMLHVLQVSAWGRYGLHFAAAALETHGRRESVTTSWSSRCCWHQRRSSGEKVGSPPRCSVCGDKRRAGWKKTFLWGTPTAAARSSVVEALLLDYAPGRRGDRPALNAASRVCDFCASAQSAVSGYQLSVVGRFFALHLLGFFFFPPLFLSIISQNLNIIFQKTLQPQREHGDI